MCFMSAGKKQDATDAYNRGESSWNGYNLMQATPENNAATAWANKTSGKNMYFSNAPTGVAPKNQTFTTYQSKADGSPLADAVAPVQPNVNAMGTQLPTQARLGVTNNNAAAASATARAVSRQPSMRVIA
jgi:hypothetical protein